LIVLNSGPASPRGHCSLVNTWLKLSPLSCLYQPSLLSACVFGVHFFLYCIRGASSLVAHATARSLKDQGFSIEALTSSSFPFFRLPPPPICPNKSPFAPDDGNLPITGLSWQPIGSMRGCPSACRSHFFVGLIFPGFRQHPPWFFAIHGDPQFLFPLPALTPCPASKQFRLCTLVL